MSQYNEADVRALWRCARTHNSSIPDEALDAMRDALFTTLRQQAARVDVTDDNSASVAAIQFALHGEDGMAFLRCWNEGNFDACREEWPEAPAECYIGADPLEAALSAQPAEPVLDADARIGNMVFRKGVRWSTVIGAAQRQSKYREAQPAERQGEAVAYITADNLALLKRDDGSAFGHMTAPIYSRARSEREIPLYLHPAAPVGVPDGMVLVPREPTPEMLEATRQHVASTLVNMSIRRTIYRAMLAAAPSAPQGSAQKERK